MSPNEQKMTSGRALQDGMRLAAADFHDGLRAHQATNGTRHPRGVILVAILIQVLQGSTPLALEAS